MTSGDQGPGPADEPPEGGPDTGSSEEDPTVEGTGLPPEGTDPMETGEAPSG